MHDPRVPETLEGWALLHQMFHVRWDAWRELPKAERRTRAAESAEALSAMNQGPKGAVMVSTLIGHKGDLMLAHFRPGFEDLQGAEQKVAQLPIWPYLQPATSYVSVDSTRRSFGLKHPTNIVESVMANRIATMQRNRLLGDTRRMPIGRASGRPEIIASSSWGISLVVRPAARDGRRRARRYRTRGGKSSEEILRQLCPKPW